MAMETPKISSSATATGTTTNPATPAITSNAAKVTSKTSALDAASGTSSMEAELQATESGPPKIDGDKLVSDIGATDSVNAADAIRTSQQKMGEENVKQIGKSTAGTAMEIGGAVIGVVGLVLLFIAPPVGAIVGAAGGLLAMAGSQKNKSAQKTAQIEQGVQEDKMARLDTQAGESRPNIINEQLSTAGANETSAGPSSGASATIEHGSTTV